jgi:8-oxo-dGTP pyrophosphatase MutT (NUDIX family)
MPGGGKKKGETDRAAVLRELRQEIGLTAYSSVELVCCFTHRPDFRHGEASLFVVRGVQYRPRWSLEVKEVGEFTLDALPIDTATVTFKLLELASHRLPAR